jgi:iron(III) transport system ATP-binding protein
MTRLELRGIRKSFGDHLAVDIPELDLPAGELSVLLGPSGCGKTTLLRILAGFERPDAGCVKLGDELLTAPGRHVPAERRGIGMVFQDQALFPHLRVSENIAFGLPRGRAARAARRQRVEELIELVGLEGMAGRFPHELSGGQQQRVALARALAPSPGILLLDEPFSGLDLETRVRVRGEVRSILAAAGATALLVTHDQDEALSLARLLLVMRDGRIVQRGAPAELYREPASPWVAGFLGEVDVLPGAVREGVIESELGPVAADLPDGPVELAIRPESLGISDAAAAGQAAARLVSTEFFGHDLVLHLVTPSGAELRARVMGPALLADAARWAALDPGTELGIRLVGEARIFGAFGAAQIRGSEAPPTPA